MSKSICEAPGCTAWVRCKGLCGMHYARLRNLGSLTLPERTREYNKDHPLYSTWVTLSYLGRCSDWDDFSVFKAQFKQAPGPGYTRKKRDKSLPWGPDNFEWVLNVKRKPKDGTWKKPSNERWMKANGEARHGHMLSYRFGVSREFYEQLLQKQKGVCAICKGSQKKRLAVDHCHSTGEIRGLLCHYCNVALGSFKDNVNVIRSAAEYVLGSKTGVYCKGF